MLPGVSKLLPLIAAGKLRINIDQTYPLDAVARAQEHNRRGSTRGKVVIDMGVAAAASRRSSQLQSHDAGDDDAEAD
jgi:hypothetical protein